MKNRNNKNKLRFSICILFLAVFLTLNISTVYADVPYESYSYDFWGEDVVQPPAYLHKATIDENSMGTSISYPEDMFVYQNDLYIADTGNSRILILDKDGNLKQEIGSFDNHGEMQSFNKPKGIFVTEEGHMYIADSDNGRIVELESNGDFIREIGRPDTELITENQAYIPTKVVVDKAGRIYTICYGINMGLVEFNKYGEFQGFMGATEVSVSTFDYIWKNYFSTDAQKERMETIIPTEYSNIFIDNENFVYTTISNLSNQDLLQGADAVRRLNPTGTDILRRLGNYPINGDLYSTSEDAAWSKFVDIHATEYGCYYALDAAGGKIFAYDYDGNSLFIFGSIGSREGNVQNPVAIGVSNDESRLYILDSLLNNILVFEITEYGGHLLSALEKNSLGDSDGSYKEWQEVLRANANSEFAYIGIGKTFLKEGKYEEAMKYFKLGNSRKYYTKAFKFYRKEYMQENFGKFMGAIGFVVFVLVAFITYRKIKRWVGDIKCNI
jgi:DNA-binding beta-propeller fold protein YncE